MSPYAVVNNRTMRAAIERLEEIAVDECGIGAGTLHPKELLHLGGPPVDNVAIDIEGEKTLKRLAGLSGLVGLVLAYACFRSFKLTFIVLLVAIFSAGASLAIVFYFGAFEVLVAGAKSQRLGKLDAILMSMPAVVYVLSLSGAIHLVNYYRDACAAGGRRGAVERAVRMSWMPCALAAFTTAIGLASLASSDILPIEKFGVFSAIGVIAAIGLLFSLVPVALHRFPPPEEAEAKLKSSGALPGWALKLAETICRRNGWVAVGTISLMLLLGFGVTRIESSVQLLKLLDSKSDLVQDYAWMEAHLGNLVPMEVIVAVPAELRRGENDEAEADGEHYAMNPLERLLMIERIGDRIETLDAVSRVLDASTFSTGDYETDSPANRRTHDYIVSRAIGKSQGDLGEYLQLESTATGQKRELWRASARIAALKDIDYGQFVDELRASVEPVLDTYRYRSALVKAMAQRDSRIAGAKICFVVPTEFTSSDALFAELLREAGVNISFNGRRGRLRTTTIDKIEAASDTAQQQLVTQDAVVVIDAGLGDRLAKLHIEGLPLINLANDSLANDSLANDSLNAIDQQASELGLSAVYTGVVPLVYKTQRELLVSLQESLLMATVLIALVLMVLLRSIGAGLISMIPNLFPIVVVFGALGWIGIKVDIGIMMTASVALGVAVDDTIHFVSWFRRGLSRGLSRYDAAIDSYQRCGVAMVQTTLIAGLGLAVFAFSTFTPTQQFGYMMVTILTAALVGDLILLPALLVGPLGSLFPASAPVAIASANSEEPVLPAPASPALVSPVSPGEPAEVTSEEPIAPLDAKSARTTADQAHQSLSPANAALRNKLRSFRRP